MGLPTGNYHAQPSNKFTSFDASQSINNNADDKMMYIHVGGTKIRKWNKWHPFQNTKGTMP